MHADALDLATTADTAVHPLWQQQLGLLLQSTGDGIFGIDLDGRCMFINRAGARLIGHAPAALLGRNMHEVTHHSHADGAHYADEDCPIFNAFRRGLPCRIDSEVFWRADGTAFPVEYSSYPIVDGGEVRGAVITFVDITERRRAADALRHARDELEQRVAERTHALSLALQRQRELSAHLDTVREEERTRIAREVHDELGSLLVALKMDVNWLDKRLAEQQARSAHEAEAMRTRMRSKCSNMSRLIESAVDNVGRIITDLRPSILDHQGLWAALEWQAQEFVAAAELRLHWRMQVAGAPEPGGAQAMAVFRIFQEMLSNVGRHAHARTLSVDVQACARQLRLAVHDDGVGAPPAAFEAGTAYGVMGMRERARHFGGRIEIASVPGAGATFSLQMPLGAAP
ncbi:PAS domain-containing sensor histidine kinase [Pseudorhodoferax sp. Leaf265]|jgi:PAS domain S-box-containing protein|uniref:sensor histidine kinase n=1 Tax=Pseudorhodoferax sp. Leaf265 TaxID=1736315 RepID=UPI0006F7DD68|nr:PAS domain-containing sensor histidine kinase [Pseudorhodoferax sp. Leaf265]KQP15883.1 histidine kinase [Pseudorhodoferax sp. Leaf265]PZQ01515.1 MAG: PAS domain S-box protein [Variovorax paradoxus]PZQ14594.1 MAG: PAS domain S-box protein [Variovorax paradoxus]